MAQNMRLIRIDDAAQNQWAYGRKVARGFATTWIGANDITTEGDWRWPDNTAFWLGKGAAAGGVPVGGRYSAWEIASDQPWADLPCAETHAYICEEY